MSESIVRISGVSKSYKKGLGIRRFYGLKDFSLEIAQGEVLGVIGPNGAGKTTTFKLILGLIYPDKGAIQFGSGLSANGADPRAKIGFLPENPYFYSYLTVEEAVDFYARLFGLDQRRRRDRVEEMLELVGMTYARKRQLGKLSRGMLQRVGIAQAILNDPELLILDEPMSGLDPIGRKEIRDIILDFGKKGRTVIFSSHILSDVEMICDRVAMILDGELKAAGPMDDLFGQGAREWEIEYAGSPLEIANMDKGACQIEQKGEKFIVKIHQEVLIHPIIDAIRDSGGRLIAFNPKRTELEKIYLSTARNREHG